MPAGKMPDKADPRFWNRLYRQQADGTFPDVTEKAGVSGMPQGTYGMGVATADYDNDGDTDLYVTGYGANTLHRNDGFPDIVVTALSDERYVLFRNNRDFTFTDFTTQSGLGRATVNWSGCSTRLFDYDNDGWKDLFVAQGHVMDTIALTNPSRRYMQPPLLLANRKVGSRRSARVRRSIGTGQGGVPHSATWITTATWTLLSRT